MRSANASTKTPSSRIISGGRVTFVDRTAAGLRSAAGWHDFLAHPAARVRAGAPALIRRQRDSNLRLAESGGE